MKKSKVTETGLMRTDGSIGADLGKELIKAAQAANRQAVKDAAIGHVQAIQVQLKKQRDYLASTEANIALLEGKLKAIADGEVTLSTYGNILTFTDPALQKSVVRMAECVNCGAPTGGGR